MAKNIKISDIGNRSTIIQRRAKNQTAGTRSTENTAKITTAFIRQANIKNNSVGGSDRNTNGAAKSYLLSFGCGIIETEDISKSDYSLLRSLCHDEETIENPNIFDSNAYSNLRNQGVVATDKFVGTDDPFYKLDEGLSKIERKQIIDIRNKSGANFVQFAADLYEYSSGTKITDPTGTITTVINKSRTLPHSVTATTNIAAQRRAKELISGVSQKMTAPGASTAQRQQTNKSTKY